MSFEDRIRRLCEDIIACQDENRTIALTEELRNAIHERIELVRSKVVTLPNLASARDIQAA